MSFWRQLRAKQNLAIIQNATKDLIRKNLVPNYTKSYILDNIPQMAHNRQIDRIKWLRCPNCNIELPSRELIHHHMKFCYKVERQKENEPIVGDFKPHFTESNNKLNQ